MNIKGAAETFKEMERAKVIPGKVSWNNIFIVRRISMLIQDRNTIQPSFKLASTAKSLRRHGRCLMS